MAEEIHILTTKYDSLYLEHNQILTGENSKINLKEELSNNMDPFVESKDLDKSNFVNSEIEGLQKITIEFNSENFPQNKFISNLEYKYNHSDNIIKYSQGGGIENDKELLNLVVEIKEGEHVKTEQEDSDRKIVNFEAIELRNEIFTERAIILKSDFIEPENSSKFNMNRNNNLTFE